MQKYLIIQLDDTSISFCHYENNKTKRHLISLDDLKAGIVYAMKENLTIQFVYPDYELPKEYKEVINTIDHSDIISSECQDNILKEQADIIVFNGWTELDQYCFTESMVCVLRTSKTDLFERYLSLTAVLSKVMRLNEIGRAHV